MLRLSNAHVLVSLMCAFAPAVAACGGGDGGQGADGTPNPAMEGDAGAAADPEMKPGEDPSSAGSGNQVPDPEEMAEGGSANVIEEPAGDTEAPTILSTSPADGATGVVTKSIVEIEFSEPMDQASVEAAYVSSDLPLEQGGFAWNAEGTKLTITPAHNQLAYAEGKVLDETPAKVYAITIGASAADLAHNELGADATLSFSTLRRIIAKLPADAVLSGYVNMDTASHGATIQVGDTATNATYRAALTFDLSSIAESYELLNANLVASQGAATNAPFVDLSTNAASAALSLFARTYATRPDVATGILPGALVGVFSQSPVEGARSLSVLSTVESHLQDRVKRNNLSQYVLQFPKLTDGKTDVDKVIFTEAVLELTYLTP